MNKQSEELVDLRSKWKSIVRKNKKIAAIFEFIFDPAYVSHSVKNKLLRDTIKYGKILNIGSGIKKYGNRCVNLDIEPFPGVDVMSDARNMPFKDESFDLVLLEYVTEHVSDSSKMMAEINRVLKKEGVVFSTVPFMQSYHGNPRDYYRFTVDGFVEIWQNYKFEKISCQPYGGPTSAFICIFKEFLAILLSFNSKIIYSILSQLLIIPLFPLKYLDIILAKNVNAYNMSFSLMYMGKKKENISGK